jgi:hypothetical protein
MPAAGVIPTVPNEVGTFPRLADRILQRAAPAEELAHGRKRWNMEMSEPTSC